MVNVNNVSCQELTMEEMEMVVGGDNGQGSIKGYNTCRMLLSIAGAMNAGQIAMDMDVLYAAVQIVIGGGCQYGS